MQDIIKEIKHKTRDKNRINKPKINTGVDKNQNTFEENVQFDTQ